VGLLKYQQWVINYFKLW